MKQHFGARPVEFCLRSMPWIAASLKKEIPARPADIHVNGPHVPVEEPPTASAADIRDRLGPKREAPGHRPALGDRKIEPCVSERITEPNPNSLDVYVAEGVLGVTGQSIRTRKRTSTWHINEQGRFAICLIKAVVEIFDTRPPAAPCGSRNLPLEPTAHNKSNPCGAARERRLGKHHTVQRPAAIG